MLPYIREAGGAFLASIFWGSFTCGRVLGIPLSLRFGPTQILAADLVGALLVMLALISLGTRAPDEQSLQILTSVFGFSMACTYPQAKVLPTTYGFAIDGKYMSIIMVAGSLGNVFFVMSSGSMPAPFFTVAAQEYSQKFCIM